MQGISSIRYIIQLEVRSKMTQEATEIHAGIHLNMTHKEMLAYILGLTESEKPFPKERLRHALLTHFRLSPVPPNRRNRSTF